MAYNCLASSALLAAAASACAIRLGGSAGSSGGVSRGFGLFDDISLSGQVQTEVQPESEALVCKC